ncbi:class I SAM-dependent methyltransferase [Polaromonas sp.]|uniref:class I SAM-dependent methyltransferase n=1 Tax=Polaromonas sp. TaxID=1869339 RepID=UPI003562126B
MNTLSRPCPVCHASADRGRLFLEKNIDPAKLSSFSFSSRKAPEYMCHRLLQCTVCDVVYVDQPPAADELARAYHQADYDSAEEANDAAVAYLRAAQAVLAKLEKSGSALEIGTGTGIFLDCLRQAGFSELVGVEPSTAAIRAAPAHRRAWIREGVFQEVDFRPASFDLVCCFMTLEHVRDPRVIVEAALRLLRPGGAFIAVTHDYRSPVNRLLGKRSPIIDVEHMQLFSQPSVRRLLEDAGYRGVTVQAFANRYRLGYWLRLAPLPAAVKSMMSRLLGATGLERSRVSVNVGNMFVAGFKHD